MSEVVAVPDRFWREFKTDVAGSLSVEQRSEIERVLKLAPTPVSDKISDLRMSFKWFFVRVAWGPEKRDTDRIKQEQEQNPPLAPRNLPMLGLLYAGFVGMVLVALVVAAHLLSRFMF